MHTGLHDIRWLVILALCCSCASTQTRISQAEEKRVAPPVHLEIEHCPQEKLLRWRVAVGLRHGIDLSQDLPTWPSGYAGFIRGREDQWGQAMGGGTSHLACECPEGLCPCDQAIQKGQISGWQLTGENEEHRAAPTTFGLRLSVPEGYEMLLPQGFSEREKSKAIGLQLTFQLAPERATMMGSCQRLPVSSSTRAPVFPPGSN